MTARLPVAENPITVGLPRSVFGGLDVAGGIVGRRGSRPYRSGRGKDAFHRVPDQTWARAFFQNGADGNLDYH
jgi:hypothetical protein